MESAMNRRNFLKAAIASGAVIAAGGALAGCSPNGGSTGGSGEAEQVVGTAPVSFSEETDVLILGTVSYTHLRAHETGRNLVCRLLLEKKHLYTSPSPRDRQKSRMPPSA